MKKTTMATLQIGFSILFTLIPCWTQGQQINTVEVGSTRYYISDFSPYSSRFNWFLAFQYCNTIGMELLSMPKHEETLELFQFLENSGKSESDYWTSGNQLGSPMWTWMSSGQPFNSTFNYWDAQGPPLTKGTKSCMDLQNSRWSASNCMEEKSFICQLTRCYYFNYAVTTRQGNKSVRLVTSEGITKAEINDPTSIVTKNQQNQNNSNVSISKSIGQSRHNTQNSNQHTAAFPADSEAATFRPVNPLPDRLSKIHDYSNEIHAIGLLSQELTPPQVISQDQSEIATPWPIANQDSIIQKLKRKETFSWALADDSHSNPK